MRKLLKKVLVLFAVLAASFAIATPALAKGTITIANPGNETYRAYKVFDAENTNGEITYSIKSDSKWYPVVTDNAVEGLEFILSEGTNDTYIVTERPGFDAAEFAKFLKGHIPDGATVKNTNENSHTIGGNEDSEKLENGYYLVVSADTEGDQARAMLTTVLDNDVTIQNKNDMPLDKTYTLNDSQTAVKEGDVQIGDVLHYTVTGKVPDTTGFTSYAYVLSDEMSTGLTFDRTSFHVTIKGTDVTDKLLVITDENALVSGSSILYTDTGFKLSLAVLHFDDLDLSNINAGDDIVLTYSSTVNENAAAKINWNRAVLKYSNDPNSDELTVKDTETTAYTSRIQVDKYELGAPEQKLSGAKFVLSKTDNGATKYFKFDTTNKKVTWVDTQAAADEVVTNSDGSAEFNGLEDGTYKLIETAAPLGYIMLQEPIAIEVNGKPATTVGLTDAQVQLALTKIANVANTPGTLLPSTGGMGTTLFYAASAVLLVIIVKRFARNDQSQTA